MLVRSSQCEQKKNWNGERIAWHVINSLFTVKWRQQEMLRKLKCWGITDGLCCSKVNICSPLACYEESKMYTCIFIFHFHACVIMTLIKYWNFCFRKVTRMKRDSLEIIIKTMLVERDRLRRPISFIRLAALFLSSTIINMVGARQRAGGCPHTMRAS